MLDARISTQDDSDQVPSPCVSRADRFSRHAAKGLISWPRCENPVVESLRNSGFLGEYANESLVNELAEFFRRARSVTTIWRRDHGARGDLDFPAALKANMLVAPGFCIALPSATRGNSGKFLYDRAPSRPYERCRNCERASRRVRFLY